MLLSRFAASLRTKKADEARRQSQSPPRPRSVLFVNGASLVVGGHGEFRVPGVHTVIRQIDDFSFRVTPSATRAYEVPSGSDMADFDLVHVVSHPQPTDALLSAIAEHLAGHHRPLTNMAGTGAPSRLMQMMRLARSGICVPRTCYLSPQRLAEAYSELVADLGYPFLLTRLVSYGSEGEWLIDSEAAFEATFWDPELIMAQEYIPNRGLYRLLVLGGRVVHATSVRSAYYGSGAGEAERPLDQLSDVRDLDPKAVRTAVLAAEAMGYEMSAVLLVQHSVGGTWYVLEAQHSTGIGGGPFPELETTAYSTYLRHKLASRSVVNQHSAVR